MTRFKYLSIKFWSGRVGEWESGRVGEGEQKLINSAHLNLESQSRVTVSSHSLESQSLHAQPTVNVDHFADTEAQITARQHRHGSPDIFSLAPSWHRR
jgi:hypothetical protein